MPISYRGWDPKTDEVWKLYKQSESNPAIGAWPHFRRFADFGFAIICQCEAITSDDGSEIHHVFYCLNTKPKTYTYRRSVTVPNGAYHLFPGKDILAVSVRPESMSSSYGYCEGSCGKVSKPATGTLRVETSLDPKEQGTPKPSLLVCSVK